MLTQFKIDDIGVKVPTKLALDYPEETLLLVEKARAFGFDLKTGSLGFDPLTEYIYFYWDDYSVELFYDTAHGRFIAGVTCRECGDDFKVLIRDTQTVDCVNSELERIAYDHFVF